MNDKDIDKIMKELLKVTKSMPMPVVTEIKLVTNRDAYKILISTMLSLRTKDSTTRDASMRLFEKAGNPKDMLKLSEEEIAKLIYPVGFYRVKAKNILEVSKTIIDDYNGKVPDEIDELLKLRGVGRKVANLVITEAFDKYGICVDTHVHRISNRFGYVSTKKPEQTEFALRKKLPKKYWRVYNDTLVIYGQNLCKPINPLCNQCSVSKYCDYFKNKN
ncbi:endonuclease III [Brachyspira aalborgi]|mgnify:FL=1|jgi:endonuclease-3|uniref:Endonuclease III n=1 Tax=Brachyspira aalborgi TaxID=29522 RepID=A0A5C8E438_9SPIR|nr:endonuclease III [Brachyspira aalborgi]TXJ32133.1 endonuclease III [Brachyspira aalborgi]TXJ32623.1 endonuclease III [Brachyspira aalborgi]TXJ42491.1 endonuclease III [Brachyspira aalborgi]CCY76854.1 endonuclease III [Brachyspira sp. CAG:700]